MNKPLRKKKIAPALSVDVRNAPSISNYLDWCRPSRQRKSAVYLRQTAARQPLDRWFEGQPKQGKSSRLQGCLQRRHVTLRLSLISYLCIRVKSHALGHWLIPLCWRIAAAQALVACRSYASTSKTLPAMSSVPRMASLSGATRVLGNHPRPIPRRGAGWLAARSRSAGRSDLCHPSSGSARHPGTL